MRRVSIAGTTFDGSANGGGNGLTTAVDAASSSTTAAAVASTGTQPEEVIGDATIKHLDELRNVEGWKDLFVRR